jgi:hypothetical protein
MVDGSRSVYEATLLINRLVSHLQASFEPIFRLWLAKFAFQSLQTVWQPSTSQMPCWSTKRNAKAKPIKVTRDRVISFLGSANFWKIFYISMPVHSLLHLEHLCKNQ